MGAVSAECVRFQVFLCLCVCVCHLLCVSLVPRGEEEKGRGGCVVKVDVKSIK